jgi:hypothetical protein
MRPGTCAGRVLMRVHLLVIHRARRARTPHTVGPPGYQCKPRGCPSRHGLGRGGDRDRAVLTRAGRPMTVAIREWHTGRTDRRSRPRRAGRRFPATTSRLGKSWALGTPGPKGLTVVGALELAALDGLTGYLTPREVAVAWGQVREGVTSTFLGTPAGCGLPQTAREATAVSSPEALREAVAHGRPVQVIPLGARLEEVSRAFQRWAGAGLSSPRDRTERRRGAAGA